MTTSKQIPVIDIAPFTTGTDPASKDVAAQVGDACTRIGFVVITGHGIDPELVARINDRARTFFDLPEAVKCRFASAGHHSGYFPISSANLAYSLDDATAKPDLREGFGGGRPDSAEAGPIFQSAALQPFCPSIPWPEQEVPRFRATWLEYFDAMSELAAKIMRIFAVALDMDPDYFDKMLDHHVSSLAAYNYPAKTSPSEQGQIRGGAHTDFGSLTIVNADFRIAGGLQVYDKETGWSDVPAVEGALVINIGDMMQQWTNDRWVSTLHRVANPPATDSGNNRRQSLIYFHIPNPETVVECLPSCSGPKNPAKYPPVTVGDHHLMKMNKMAVKET